MKTLFLTSVTALSLSLGGIAMAGSAETSTTSAKAACPAGYVLTATTGDQMNGPDQQAPTGAATEADGTAAPVQSVVDATDVNAVDPQHVSAVMTPDGTTVGVVCLRAGDPAETVTDSN